MVFVPSNLSLRQAKAGDVGFLVRLRNELAPFFLNTTPATAAQTFRLLAGSRTYIIEYDGRSIGSFALYNVDGTQAEFGRFMIEPGSHGMGLGGMALQLAMDCAKDTGLKSLHLTVRGENYVAQSIYQQAGFQQVGHLNGVIQMRKDL